MKSILPFILTLFSLQLTVAQPKSESETAGAAIGSRVESFVASDQYGQSFDLSAALQQESILLIFYRGQWCPFCNKHLSALQDSLEFLAAQGIRVVAVSPEKPAYLEKMQTKTGASFTLLYDQNYRIARQFDVLFLPESGTKKKYNLILNARLKEAHDNEQELLPIPASFLIGQDATLLWRHFDHDYRERSSVLEVLEAMD